MIQEVFIVTIIVFLAIIVAFAVVELNSLLSNETNVYSAIAYNSRKRKIKKDFYCFVRPFKLLKYYNRNFADTSAGKTIRTIIGKNCICGYQFISEVSSMKGTQQDIQTVENVLKIFKYILYRLENSKEYKNLISHFENNSPNKLSLRKILFDEELSEMHLNAIHCIFSATVDFLIAINQNESLHSVNTDIYFNGNNLLDFYRKEDAEKQYIGYREFINDVLGFKLYKTYD